jgi:hypothetical protein
MLDITFDVSVLVINKADIIYQTLIVPCWPSANYWSMLCPSGNGFIDQVIGYIDLPVAKMFYIPKCTLIYSSDLYQQYNDINQLYHCLTLGFKPYQC